MLRPSTTNRVLSTTSHSFEMALALAYAFAPVGGEGRVDSKRIQALEAHP